VTAAVTRRDTVVVTLPVRTVSESNVRGHWAKKAGRAKGQRALALLSLRGAHVDVLALPVRVLLTRIAPRVLDDDNLRAALKAIRDGVADALGVDDRDPRVMWSYDQRRGAPGRYGVEVVVYRDGAESGAGVAKAASGGNVAR